MSMNRRNFIKTAGLSTALATWTVTCKYEEEGHTEPKGEEGEKGEAGCNWNYRVYCYEREQGEWIFSQNIRGSFAYQREYATAEENAPYCGWMNDGKLHFNSLEEAQDFVEMHVRAKDDLNLVDSIYDIYRVDTEPDPTVEGGVVERESQVAHYWFNGDTGRQVSWTNYKDITNWNKVEHG